MLVKILVEGLLASLEVVIADQDLLDTAHHCRLCAGGSSLPVDCRCYSMSRSRRLVLPRSMSSDPSPDKMVLVAYSVKPLISP